MSLFWHQVEKDIYRLRWLLAPWVLLVVAESTLLGMSGAVSRGWALHLTYKLIAMLLPLMQYLLMIVMVPLLVHEEPLVGTTAAWFTRPLSRRTLLASKTAFLLLILVLVPLGAELAALAANDARSSELARAAAEIALTRCSLVASLAALAALTPNFARFIMWGAAIWGVYTLVASAAMVRTMMSPEGILALADPRVLRASAVASLGAILLAGSAAVVHQYLTRRVRRSVAIAATGLVASLAFSMGWTWTRPSPASRPGGPTAVQLLVDTGSVMAMDTFSLQAAAPRRKTIWAATDCLRTPPGTFCELDDLRGALRYPDGGVVPVERARRPGLTRLHRPSLEQALGGSRVVNDGLRGLGTGLFEVDHAVYAERGRTPAVLEANGTVTLKRYRVAASLPLQRGAFHADGAERVTITDVLRGPGTCQVVLVKRRLDLVLSAPPATFPGFGDLLAPVSYVLVNAERKQAFVPEFVPAFDLAGSLAQALPTGQRLTYDPVSLLFTSESQFETLPRLDDAWLSGASLVLVEADVEGRTPARVLVPDLVLARREMHHRAGAPEVEAGLTPAQYGERGAGRLEDGLGHPVDGDAARSWAEAYLMKAVEGDPDLAAPYGGLALIAASSEGTPRSRRDAAQAWLDKGRVASADPAARRVEAYLLEAEQGDAAAVMEQVVEHSPGSSAYWRDLGYFRTKDYRLRRALEAYDRALATRPDPVEAARVQAQRGESYAFLARPAEARKAYEDAVGRRPDFAPYWRRLCQVRREAGDCGGALEAARRAQGLETSTAASSCLLRAQICLGQVDEGSPEVRRAWGWDLIAIGDFFRDKGDESRARGYYRRAELHPDDWTLALSSSELELRSGGPDQALEILRPALAAHPQEPALLAQAAVVHARRGDGARALDLAGQALEARLDAATVRRLEAALGGDPEYARRRRRITARVEGLFGHYERKFDHQYLRRDLPTTEWVIGHAGATHKDREAVPHLILYLQESAFATTRAKAADALWYIGDGRAVPALVEALSDPDLKVQGFAASGLGALGDPAAVSPLLDLFARLPDNREETKARVADALGKLGDKRALAPIRESLAHIQDPAYLRWARPALARLEALPAGPG